MGEILDISCDEAGHTGPDLLHAEQRYFGFASVALRDDEALRFIKAARQAHPVQIAELKATKLLRSKNGCALVADLIANAEGRYAVTVSEKLLALCGWVFEYIYEPVYKRDPTIFYRKNFHRFVAMFTWLWFQQAGSEAQRAVRQFQVYMRSRNEADAPLLFGRLRKPLSPDALEHPFELVLRFARGYRDLIIADNKNLDTLADKGRWTLDLSASSLWSHLVHWGARREPLRVRCDASKPLQDIAERMSGEVQDYVIRSIRRKGTGDPHSWKLAEPIAFVDSQKHPAVQYADIVAGTVVSAMTSGTPAGFEGTMERVQKHALKDCILPDMDVIDLAHRAPTVNYLMLYDLALRAERGLDPYFNVAEMYHAAEVSWARGDYHAIQKEYAIPSH